MGINRVTEKAFMATVRQYALLRGWLVHHVYDSRRSQPGFPDLVMLRRGRLVFAELKVGKNKTTPDQDRWLAELDLVSVAAGCEVVACHLWTPRDWPEIEEVLA